MAWIMPLLFLLLGCGGAAPPSSSPVRKEDDLDPPSARREQAEILLADLAAQRSPADGGGSVELVLADGEEARIECGELGTWTLIYTAGPRGIAEGGALRFLPDPFWNWSQPQTRDANYAGYTTIESSVPGLRFETFEQSTGPGGAGSVTAILRGAGLTEGAKVRLVYGAGSVGAAADRYAEREARLWLAVDGDGDGVTRILDDSPRITVTARPFTRLVLNGPSVARPGESLKFHVALLDEMANLAEGSQATLRITQRPAGWDFPQQVTLRPQDRGTLSFQGTALAEGVVRLAVETELDGRTLRAEAAPLAVSTSLPRIRWADLHGHSQLSDGTGTPEDWWRYAREAAGLDAAALTDHDHFGVRFVDQHPEIWSRLVRAARAAHQPGEFVALVGFEWTNWIHGHRHVLYFSDDGRILSSLDPAYDTPRKLWKALEGQSVLTLAHHSAGDPVPTNWTFKPPPQIEPVTEVMSVHGSSEALDSPMLIRGAIPGNTVRDQLDSGMKLGFIGSGDGHDGHPGLPHLSPAYGYSRDHVGRGGLAAILSEDLTREGLYASLRARRCYATSGPRILLQATLDGSQMGSELEALSAQPLLRVFILGTVGLKSLDLVYSDRIERVELGGQRRFEGTLQLNDIPTGGYLYLRVEQQDGALAWSSPWFVK